MKATPQEQAFKKPSADYYNLDLIKRKSVINPQTKHPKMTADIETDYRAFIDSQRGNKSITAYLHELLDIEMCKQGNNDTTLNGFKLLANSYRKSLHLGVNTDDEKTDLIKQIKVLDFLATCDDKEKEMLFNTSAFNDLVVDCVANALDYLSIDAETSEKILDAIRDSFR